jgi:two-component system OmpR family sensor kinase
MTRSIRWTLLLGHAGILAAVMAAFGGLLYLGVRASTMGAVESELAEQGRALAVSMDPRAPGRFEVILSDAQVRYFQSTAGYVIWDREGRVVDATSPGLMNLRPRPAGPRLAGEDLEVTVPGPDGSTILVIKSAGPQLASLRNLLGLIAAVGLAFFSIGAAGGWFLIGRLLGPIRRITRTAASISESNLSSRIDVAVTERELAELARTLNETFDKLQAAFERRREFTADAAHELRTPLTILTTQLELALRRPRTADEHRETIEVCLKAVRRMTSLAERLLLLSKADSRRLALDRSPVDLKEIVDEAVAFIGPAAAERNVRLKSEAESWVVAGDRSRLGEAVLNLLANAVQYNRPDGSVAVSLKDGALAVTDTGAGIAESDQGRVFERFFRADKARSRHAGGAGLGLAITKAIIEAHGGTITFASAPGKGTTFTVAIPGTTPAAANTPVF